MKTPAAERIISAPINSQSGTLKLIHLSPILACLAFPMRSFEGDPAQSNHDEAQQAALRPH
jgi:hypothetical protein